MIIGIMNNLPELVGGICAIAITVIITRVTILWPIIGSKKIKQMVGK